MTDPNVDYIVAALNGGFAGAGSCGAKADKVAARAVAADVRKDGALISRRLSELRVALMPHLTYIYLSVLRLGCKTSSLRKTHCVRIFLRHDSSAKRTKVEKCEAAEIAKLVAANRRHVPVVPVESRLGTADESSLEELLCGTSTHIQEEAARRESVYLPVMLVELSEAGMHQFHLPNFLAKSEVKKYQKLKLGADEHQVLLAAELNKIEPVAGSPVGL